MNKTIFRLDYKISILIISFVGIFIGFISNVYNVNGFLEFIFYFIKLLLLTGVFLLFYLIENKNKEFKNKLKYLLGNLLVFNGMNIVFAIFSIVHLIPYLFITLSGVVSLYVIFMFVLEILNIYFENETIVKIIAFNKKIGDTCVSPILKTFEKITND